jgi:hypothetical protein
MNRRRRPYPEPVRAGRVEHGSSRDAFPSPCSSPGYTDEPRRDATAGFFILEPLFPAHNGTRRWRTLLAQEPEQGAGGSRCSTARFPQPRAVRGAFFYVRRPGRGDGLSRASRPTSFSASCSQRSCLRQHCHFTALVASSAEERSQANGHVQMVFPGDPRAALEHSRA